MATAAVVEYGFDEDRFEEAVSDNFRCGICLNVLNNPKSCQNNQHYYCFGCITQHLKNYQTCPNCAEELNPETLGTPPRVLLNCISELRVKCDHIKRGCCDRVQLGNLQTHLDQCGFAPVTCGNDVCEMKINRRDKIHHETELCKFGRVQCHDCRELKDEIVKIGTKQDQLNKSQAKLEEKLNEVTTRLANVEKNVITQVNKLYHESQSENAVVVKEISNIKHFMSDVLLNLSSINTAVCEIQSATKQDAERNEKGDLQDSASKPSSSLKAIEQDPVFQRTPVVSQRSYVNDTSVWSPRFRNKPTDESARTKDIGDSMARTIRLRHSSPSYEQNATERRHPEGTRRPFAPDTPQDLNIGMTVLVSRHHGKLSRGVVKFIGPLPDKEDVVYVGLELYDGDGKHDGVYGRQRIFTCKPNHGMFFLFGKVVMAYP